MNETFWVVWHMGGNAPKVTHKDFAAAKAEAERLAAQNPGKEFFVLQAVGAAKTTDVTWREIGAHA